MPQSTIRILFSILGDIIFFDYYSSIARRDGTFECVVVYRELSEAQLAAKLDGTELGDRCLEVRLSQSIDRFDISFSSSDVEGCVNTSRTLLVKSEDMSCNLDKITQDFNIEQGKIHRFIELERDLGAGLPALTARFFLIEFSSMEAALAARMASPSSSIYSIAEAYKHMQTYTVGSASSGSSFNYNTSSTSGNTDEILIYGVPASKLLDPTTTRSYNNANKPSTDDKYESSTRSSRSRSRSRENDHRRRDDYHRSRSSRDYDRSRRRSRSRSGERRRHH